MKDLSFYEQVGIVLPGSVLLLGILFLAPELRGQFIATGGVSVGGLGLFLLVAYVLGHLVAAGGNLLETIVWRWGGRPSQRPAGKEPGLLRPYEIGRVEAKLKARLGIAVSFEQLSGPEELWPHFRRLYAEVQTFAPGDLSETYNGIYGLNRGLALAMLLVAVGCIIRQGPYWLYWAIGAAVCAAIYIYRMRLFGRLFAERVYDRFMQLPDRREPAQAARKPKES